MAERLGNVLYWAKCSAAVVAAGSFVFFAVVSGEDDWWITVALGVELATGLWLLGHALKHILAGR